LTREMENQKGDFKGALRKNENGKREKEVAKKFFWLEKGETGEVEI